jgi:DNA-binding XRE family transcriptional regulator
MARDTRTRVFPNLVAYFNDDHADSQAQVARELGISTAFLSMIKWRERQPELKLAMKISERCHVPLESLVRKAS